MAPEKRYQISMDGTNVNLKFFKDFRKLLEDLFHSMIDIVTCGLHSINRAMWYSIGSIFKKMVSNGMLEIWPNIYRISNFGRCKQLSRKSFNNFNNSPQDLLAEAKMVNYHLSRCWGQFFFSKLDKGSYTISIAKTAFKKIGALIHSMMSLSPEALCITINLPYGFAWSTLVMSALVPVFNSLPIECLPLIYDLIGFKSRISRHFLTIGSF